MTIDLRPHTILRPEKIRWRFEHGDAVSVLDAIPSRSLRKFLRHIDKYMDQNGLRYERKEVTDEIYAGWYAFYLQKIQEHHYRAVATPSWFQEKLKEQKKVEGIFIYQNDELVSAGMIVLEGDKATLAMSAGEYLHLSGKSNASLGSILNYLFLTSMFAEGFPVLSGGQSRNAFGVFNSLGYLEYKLRIGYIPSSNQGTTLTADVPCNEEGIAVFFGFQDEVLKLFVCVPKQKDFHLEKGILQQSGIETVTIYY